jgi:hypothetical protein
VNPAWWAVLIPAAVGVNQTKPWEWFEGAKPKPRPPPQQVGLIEPHAAANAPYQWEADVRVINETNRDIKVERSGQCSDSRAMGASATNGDAMRILFPVTAPGQLPNVYVSLKRGEGTLFKGWPESQQGLRWYAMPTRRCKTQTGRSRDVHRANG